MVLCDSSSFLSKILLYHFLIYIFLENNDKILPLFCQGKITSINVPPSSMESLGNIILFESFSLFPPLCSESGQVSAFSLAICHLLLDTIRRSESWRAGFESVHHHYDSGLDLIQSVNVIILG